MRVTCSIGLLQRLGGVDADDPPPARPFEGEAGDHAGVRGAGDGAHDHVVEEDAALGFLRGDLAGPVGEAEPAERVVGCAGRDRVRLAAGGVHGFERPLPAVPHADVEAGLVEADVAAHDARQLDVADAAVVLVGFFDPVLLHRHGGRGRGGRRRRSRHGCGWTGPRRSTPGCRTPGRARRPRGTRACGPCCPRRRCRSCSPPAWPTPPRRHPVPRSRRGSGWIGDGPNSSGTRSKSSRVIAAS